MSRRAAALILAMLSSAAYSDYREDVGYFRLQGEFGALLPDGSGVAVTQVEAAVGASASDAGAWMPDVNAAQFSGKTIVDRSVPPSNGISGHATGVATLFYGSLSMAFGISDIDVYSASDWITSGFLNAGTGGAPAIASGRIANHSWVGAADSAANSATILKRLDWEVERNEFVQVVAMNNGSLNQPLLGNSYNSIAVGRTDANHAQGTLALDPVYAAGRTRPDVVVPLGTTSSAAPIVAAATAMLIGQAHGAAQGPSAVIANGDTIYNGERSEVVKAVMMAGAERTTRNVSSVAQIGDYHIDTANGLDSRFGAGQLNVYNNYRIVAAGEQDSLEDGGAATVGPMGYDYDAAFGGAQGSNDTASYAFETTQSGVWQLTASLIWNIGVEDAPGPGFDPTATLFNLDLLLYDVTDGVASLLAGSESAIDNSENLWFFLEGGHDYQLKVAAADGSPFVWDYGLAWKIAPVPGSSAIWSFLGGMAGLLGLAVRRSRVTPGSCDGGLVPGRRIAFT